MTQRETSRRPMTMEQRRAKDAWQCAKDCSKGYANLAKGLPALIMNSGLMPVMAFLHEKSSKESGKEHGLLAKHLRAWLHERCRVSPDFEQFMEEVVDLGPREYQALTIEAFAWLKWLRQMAAARQGMH